MDFLDISVAAMNLVSAVAGPMIDKTDALRYLARSCLEVITSDNGQIPQDMETALVEYCREVLEVDEGVNGKQISLRRLLNLKKEMLLKIQLKERVELNPLPEVFGGLNRLDLCRIFYPELQQQKDGYSCGYWAAYNSEAIYELQRTRRALTIKNLRNLTVNTVEKLLQRLSKRDKHDLRDIDIVALIRQRNLARTYILSGCDWTPPLIRCYTTVRNQAYQSLPSGFMVQDVNADGHLPNGVLNAAMWPAQRDYKVAEFDQFFTNIYTELRDHRNESLVFNFICTFPYNVKRDTHWILISVIKPAYQKPFILILDAIDFPFPLGGNEQYVVLLYNRLVLPFYPPNG